MSVDAPGWQVPGHSEGIIASVSSRCWLNAAMNTNCFRLSLRGVLVLLFIAISSLAQEAAEGLVHRRLPDRPPGVGGEVLEGLAYPDLRLLEECGAVGVLAEAAGDQLGTGHDGAGGTLDGEVDDDQAVLGELAAVAENDVGGVLQTEAVDVDVAGGHAAL